MHFFHTNKSRIRAEPIRLIVAARYLGTFTRRDMAEHLGMSKSGFLAGKIEQLVKDHRLTKSIQAHPQNGRPTIYYRSV